MPIDFSESNFDPISIILSGAENHVLRSASWSPFRFVLLLFDLRPFWVLAGGIERSPAVLSIRSRGKGFKIAPLWVDNFRAPVREVVEVFE